MINPNQSILNALEKAKRRLNADAKNRIISFISSKLHQKGGFMDRAGKADPYYSVFGYTTCYLLDIHVDIQLNIKFLKQWETNNRKDFIHVVSLLRCYYLLHVLKLKQKFGRLAKSLAQNASVQEFYKDQIAKEIKSSHKVLIEQFFEYQTDNQGFNHLEKGAKYGTSYGNFLATGIFEDLFPKENRHKGLLNSTLSLLNNDGTFVNFVDSEGGMSTNTAAGIIILLQNEQNANQSINWLKEQLSSDGGFFAGKDVPIPDLLSTATSLLALSLAGEKMDWSGENIAEFINIHWDNSGGFFGSIADRVPDVEYTFYGLLAIGLID